MKRIDKGAFFKVEERLTQGSVWLRISTAQGNGWELESFLLKKSWATSSEMRAVFPSLIVTDERKKTTVECLKYTLPVSFVVPREVLPLVKSIRLDRLR